MPARTSAKITAPASPVSTPRVCAQNGSLPSSAPTYRTSSGMLIRAKSAVAMAANFAST